ncbi:MAG: hypothetical protein NZ517_07190 [Candidatus Nitrosocaldus sp.]|nr:hypothetical protein [Candidatus Nitrosocaldus sp.]
MVRKGMTLVGLKGGDVLYGDGLYGGNDDDTLQGGNDTLKGGDGDDGLYGDYLVDLDGNDTAYGGNDVIEAADGVADISINGDYISAETTTNGTQDICSTDTDDPSAMNCEYSDILVWQYSIQMMQMIQ